MPGSTPATSQLDWLSSTTAMIVLSWSKATRDLLKSFSWGIGALRQLFASDDGAISSPPAPYHLSAGGSEIRTLGPSLARGLHAVENVDVRSGRGRRLRRRRVRGRRPAGKSRGTYPLARGRCGPTTRAGNRRSRDTADCRAA